MMNRYFSHVCSYAYKAACQDKLGGKPEYFYTEEWFTCGLISGGKKEGRYIRTTGGISGFGMFLKTKIPKYTQQTKVLLTKSEHIFILVAFIQKEEVFTRIPSPRLKDERSGHRSK